MDSEILKAAAGPQQGSHRKFISERQSRTGRAGASALTDAVDARTGFVACAAIVSLFVCAAVVAATRGDTSQFDEIAHLSYIAHMRHAVSWPSLEEMRMLDPATFRFTSEANYLNHPPFYYALLAWIGPPPEGVPHALLAYRLINVLLAAIGLGAMLEVGRAARLPLYAYAVPLACIPLLVRLGACVNNDNLAFAGGGIALLGAWHLARTGRAAWLWVALAGMITAACAKLTGMLLAGGLMIGVFAYLIRRGRFESKWLAPAIIACVAEAAPSIIFIFQYGDPTPDTPAQLALIRNGATAAGWADLDRKSLPAFALYFAGSFVLDWLPALSERTPAQYAMLAIPVATLICAAYGIVQSVRRMRRRQETATDVIVLAGTFALIATLIAHVLYSYARHFATGWLLDAYPRYYLPLAAIVPLACLSALLAIENPQKRKVLAGFLIAGPIVFRLLGAPV